MTLLHSGNSGARQTRKARKADSEILSEGRKANCYLSTALSMEYCFTVVNCILGLMWLEEPHEKPEATSS
ncbi:uncharacterized protein MYCFIDRAFT_178318 [Pseudocercospora fijiensis CIRAD86]|uniref:Uncharacterized protein n=1 Tax=Pseudocercospora fijiensis (strain CIRAD86) TaxID=383855 RepID=M2ZL32_PSEFD|nr:uncharacterized protein MYCFIDRAFT_178318 [Pseudocercospora fijiensis CIRAD86]EME79759.1 hypothetical protein MYCFIDRAFT_178318 [Pseudocercospora fijiensis CIRAD86]